jgi:hypothetical protein
VAEEARRAGAHAAAWLRGSRPGTQFRLKAGANVRYVNPGKLDPRGPNKIYMRSMIVKNDAVLELRLDNRLLKSVKRGHVQPSEMIDISLGPGDLEGSGYGAESVLEFSIT